MKSCGLAIALLGHVAPAATHEPILLDPRRGTPGARLALEVAALPASSPDAPGYRLVAIGLPGGIVFNVWTKHFGHAFHETASGFQADASGRIVALRRDGAGEPQYLDQMVFQPEPETYPRGAIWEAALVSADRTVTAFAKVIPRPMVARDGPCTLTLELVSHRGERFLASGAGFAPGEDAVVESVYAGRVSRRQRRVSADGRLAPEVLTHVALSADHSARYSVKGRFCEVALEYEWGGPALRGR